MSGKAWALVVLLALLIVALIVWARGPDRTKIPGATSSLPVGIASVA